MPLLRVNESDRINHGESKLIAYNFKFTVAG